MPKRIPNHEDSLSSRLDQRPLDGNDRETEAVIVGIMQARSRKQLVIADSQWSFLDALARMHS